MNHTEVTKIKYKLTGSLVKVSAPNRMGVCLSAKTPNNRWHHGIIIDKNQYPKEIIDWAKTYAARLSSY